MGKDPVQTVEEERFTPFKMLCALLATTHRTVASTWGRTCVTTQSHGLRSAEWPTQVCRQLLSTASSLRKHAYAAAIPTVTALLLQLLTELMVLSGHPPSFRSVVANKSPLMFVENKYTSVVRLFSPKLPPRYSRLHTSPTHLPIFSIIINTTPCRCLSEKPSTTLQRRFLASTIAISSLQTPLLTAS